MPGPTLYLDTADRAAAEPWLGSGVFTGLTTNPTILARCGQSLDALGDIYTWALAGGAEEVMVQTWGPSRAAMRESARRILDLGPRVAVKVPATLDGFSVASTLVDEGVSVLVTAVHTPQQVLMAAAVGARWVAPYLGRIHDSGQDGVDVVTTMHEVLARTGSSTRLLVASVRSVESVVSLASRGVDGFTVSPAIAEQLFADAATDRAVAEFEDAVASLPA